MNHKTKRIFIHTTFIRTQQSENQHIIHKNPGLYKVSVDHMIIERDRFLFDGMLVRRWKNSVARSSRCVMLTVPVV